MRSSSAAVQCCTSARAWAHGWTRAVHVLSCPPRAVGVRGRRKAMPVLTCDARDREGRAGMGHAASRPAGPRTHGGTFCSPRPSARGRRPGSRTTGAHQGPGKEAGESEREATGGGGGGGGGRALPCRPAGGASGWTPCPSVRRSSISSTAAGQNVQVMKGQPQASQP
jgi:hypothetical protein